MKENTPAETRGLFIIYSKLICKTNADLTRITAHWRLEFKCGNLQKTKQG